jgi:hypothetical protein
MKFLHVYCENRKAEVYIALDKIVLIKKGEDDTTTVVELEGTGHEPVKVNMPSEDLIRKINGEDRIGIGFRRSI